MIDFLIQNMVIGYELLISLVGDLARDLVIVTKQ